jgi:transcriptional regulator with XRE-family HTH domain
MSLGKRVREAREAKSWSQGQLAKEIRRINPALKTTTPTISSIETSISKSPTILNELALALGVTETWLRTGKGDRTPEKMSHAEIDLILDHVREAVFASYEAIGLPPARARELVELVFEVAQEPLGAGESPAPRDRRIVAASLTRRFLLSKQIQKLGA